ncbi:MAG: cadherin-like beta sandwich domain-containing protein [Clostridia bacterium]|nr:cadherin-like beta sandwich domain-containing protein [Clostridia bacterium]
MMKLNQSINRLICILFATVFIFASAVSDSFLISSNAADEDATIVVALDRNTLNVGDTFNVKVTYESNLESGYLMWELTYDSSLVSREGSAGKIIETEWFDDTSANTKNVTKSYTFTAKAVGKVTFSINATSYKLVPDDNGDEMSILTMGASATIMDVGSSDANLKSLVVDGGELVPSFSPDITQYTVTVPFDIAALYVYPSTSDSRATHTVEGDEFLNVGTKTRTVVVTAQDGTVKKYVITITRLAKPTEAPTATPPATERPTETAKPSVTPTQVSTQTSSPTVPATTPPVENDIISVDGKEYEIVNINESVVLPEGFEKTDVEYNGKKYSGAKGISKNITLLYLESEEFTGLFVYDDGNNEFFKHVDITVKSGIYTVMKLLDGEAGLNLNKTQISIGDVLVDAYEIDPSNSEFYIVRAMNWNGDTNYYSYDTVENTMQRYAEIKFMSGSSDGNDTDNTATPVPTSTASQSSDMTVKRSSENSKSHKILIILAFSSCVICLILAAFLIYFALKERKTCKIMSSPYEESNDKLMEIEKEEETEQIEHTEEN